MKKKYISVIIKTQVSENKNIKKYFGGYMKKIILIINILMLISINLISYATDDQIEINTNISKIENGQEIEISIKAPSQENSIYTYSGYLKQ